MILKYGEKSPSIAEGCFVAENATIVGDVTIEKGASVWYGAVIRADEEPIVIGENSNVQDNAVLHCSVGYPMRIGKGVTIGHGAIVHGAVVKDNALIGMGAIVLNGAVIEENAIVGAGAVVKENDSVPAGGVAVGVPAKTVKTDPEGNSDRNKINAEAYVFMGQEHKNTAVKI